jgi:nitroreductase
MSKNCLRRFPYSVHMQACAGKLPLKILVCGDTTQEIAPGYWMQDCSATTQILLLAAHALGLGAVWTGIYPIKDKIERFIKAFALPDNLIPLAFVPYPV